MDLVPCFSSVFALYSAQHGCVSGRIHTPNSFWEMHTCIYEFCICATSLPSSSNSWRKNRNRLATYIHIVATVPRFHHSVYVMQRRNATDCSVDFFPLVTIVRKWMHMHILLLFQFMANCSGFMKWMFSVYLAANACQREMYATSQTKPIWAYTSDIEQCCLLFSFNSTFLVYAFALQKTFCITWFHFWVTFMGAKIRLRFYSHKNSTQTHTARLLVNYHLVDTICAVIYFLSLFSFVLSCVCARISSLLLLDVHSWTFSLQQMVRIAYTLWLFIF